MEIGAYGPITLPVREHVVKDLDTEQGNVWPQGLAMVEKIALVMTKKPKCAITTTLVQVNDLFCKQGLTVLYLLLTQLALYWYQTSLFIKHYTHPIGYNTAAFE